MARPGGAPGNLKPFPKGKSGNPKGRPRKLPKLEELIDKVFGEEKDGITAAEAALMALRAKAAKGDMAAIKEALDRCYGKPKQSLDLTTNGETIHNTIVFKDPRNNGVANESAVRDHS